MFGLTGLRPYGVLGAAIALALLLGWAMRLDGLRAGYKAERDAEKAAHEQTVANYRAAAEQRKASDLANVQRVAAEQSEISKEITDDYQTRIAALRADFAERVRRATQADTGGASGADMSGVPDPSRRADEATRQARLPARDALIASEQAEQLIALQAWVRAQATVDMIGEQPVISDAGDPR